MEFEIKKQEGVGVIGSYRAIRLTQNWNESMNPTVWLSCPKRLFSGMHSLTISKRETVNQFNDN